MSPYAAEFQIYRERGVFLSLESWGDVGVKLWHNIDEKTLKGTGYEVIQGTPEWSISFVESYAKRFISYEGDKVTKCFWQDLRISRGLAPRINVVGTPPCKYTHHSALDLVFHTLFSEGDPRLALQRQPTNRFCLSRSKLGFCWLSRIECRFKFHSKWFISDIWQILYQHRTRVQTVHYSLNLSDFLLDRHKSVPPLSEVSIAINMIVLLKTVRNEWIPTSLSCQLQFHVPRSGIKEQNGSASTIDTGATASFAVSFTSKSVAWIATPD